MIAKYTIALFIAVFSLASCGGAKEDTLQFAGYECLRLQAGDMVQSAQLYVEPYVPYRQIGSYDAPLSKVVRNDTALVFIGLSTDPLDSLISRIPADTRRVALDEQRTAVLFKDQKEDVRSLRAIYPAKDIDYTVVMSIVPTNSGDVDSMAVNPQFLNSILCTER